MDSRYRRDKKKEAVAAERERIITELEGLKVGQLGQLGQQQARIKSKHVAEASNEALDQAIERIKR